MKQLWSRQNWRPRSAPQQVPAFRGTPGTPGPASAKVKQGEGSIGLTAVSLGAHSTGWSAASCYKFSLHQLGITYGTATRLQQQLCLCIQQSLPPAPAGGTSVSNVKATHLQQALQLRNRQPLQLLAAAVHLHWQRLQRRGGTVG